jgi:hypothetical protein
MPQSFQRSRKKPLPAMVIGLLLLLISCNKATVNFGEEALTDDPNIIYVDSMTIDMATYQTDSFYTAGDTVFIAGLHIDSLLGSYAAKAFMQLGIPAANQLKDRNNCTFDSLVLIIRFYGSYYGDTTQPFTLKAYQLSEQVKSEDPIGFNTSSLAYHSSPLATTTISRIRPSAKAQVSLPLPQTLGQHLFGMLTRNSDTITQSDKFYKFFHGIALTGEDPQQKSVYYFGCRTSGSNTVMRLYYRENGITPQASYVDFGIAPSTFQFNSFAYNRAGTALSAVAPGKRLLIPAKETGNRIFLHGNGGLFPCFDFPALFSIKELHPYVKVIKAELEIKPPAMNYGPGNIYVLPPSLRLYTLEADNKLGTPVYNIAGTAAQTGDLVVDYLYHKDTRYTYDLTGYVNNILEQGRIYQKPLVMVPASRSYESRLVLDALNNSSAKLKLYVLGL